MILQIHVQRTWRASAAGDSENTCCVSDQHQTEVLLYHQVPPETNSSTPHLQDINCSWMKKISGLQFQICPASQSLNLNPVLIDWDNFRTKLGNSNPSVTWYRNIKSMREPNHWTTIPDLVLHVPYWYWRMREDRRRANRTCDQMLISCLVKYVSCDSRTSLIHQI